MSETTTPASGDAWLPTMCVLCYVNCGIEVRTDGRAITRVRGDTLAGTPHHKNVAARLRAASDEDAEAAEASARRAAQMAALAR